MAKKTVAPATAKTRKKTGRPSTGGGGSTFPAKVWDRLIAGVSEGRSVREMCREPGMPGSTAVYAYLDGHQEFAERFARARLDGENAIAEECLDIADDARNDWMERDAAQGGGKVLNTEHVQRSKLRIETRLKLLAKWNPKKWGERVQVDAVVDHKTVSDEALLAKLAAYGVALPGGVVPRAEDESAG